MRTEVLHVSPERPDAGAVARAAGVLARGGLVALPTETVYGLGARADDPEAVARIFAAKGRPAYNPLIVHVASVEEARALAASWPPLAGRLAAAFWPGPLTLVVPRDRAKVPDVVCAGGPTVALRMPAHPVTLAVLRALGRPLAAPSANRFQALSPTTASHVLKGLDGRVDLVLDAGPCGHGIESTVLDLSGDAPAVLRHGALPAERLREVVGELRERDAHVGDEVTEALPSPGMIRRHYAPHARLLVVRPDAVRDAVRSLPGRVGVVSWSRAGWEGAAAVRSLPGEPVGYGAGLYAALHALDDEGCDAVVVEAVPEAPGWEAVRDRLARAAE